MKIHICQLYPEIIHLYGDRGNILSLIHRGERRGIEITVDSLTRGDAFDPEKYDIVYMGGGQGTEMEHIREDFLTKKGSAVTEAVEMSKVFLCVFGGYMMMGQYCETQTGEKHPCLGALNTYAKESAERIVGDTVYHASFLPEGHQTIYGFENRSYNTTLLDGVRPLMTVVKGSGATQGAFYKQVYATYSMGPLLPRNPALTDHLLHQAIKNRYGEHCELTPLDTNAEDAARKTSPVYDPEHK